MSKRAARRIVLVTLLVFFFIVPASEPSWFGWSSTSQAFHLYAVIIWNVAILIHVFWLNRKLLFLYFRRIPCLSSQGLRQIVILLLIILLAGAWIGGILVQSMTALRTGYSWWCFVYWMTLIGHIWLNRRALRSQLGRRTATGVFLLCCAAVVAYAVGSFISTFI